MRFPVPAASGGSTQLHIGPDKLSRRTRSSSRSLARRSRTCSARCTRSASSSSIGRMVGYLRTGTLCYDSNLSLAATPRSATFTMPRSPLEAGRVLVPTSRSGTSSSPTRSQNGLFSKYDDIFYHK
eukprot:9488143-Pyramimonas_sp.AAC.1